MKHFKAISLFCGAGGLDLGFSKAGFKTIWANDFNRDACNTFRSWNTCPVVQGDIKQISIIIDIGLILLKILLHLIYLFHKVHMLVLQMKNLNFIK